VNGGYGYGGPVPEALQCAAWGAYSRVLLTGCAPVWFGVTGPCCKADQALRLKNTKKRSIEEREREREEEEEKRKRERTNQSKELLRLIFSDGAVASNRIHPYKCAREQTRL
jgi:hypothetical protein